MGEVMGQWGEHWQKKRETRDKIRADGKVVIQLAGERLQVTCPYSPVFNTRAKELGGKWRARTRFWSFPWAAHRLVLELIRDVYGAESMGQWADYQE